MKAALPCVLTINGGSSSIRFSVYEAGDSPRRRLDGKMDRIGLRGTTLLVNDPDGAPQEPRHIAATDHRAAAASLLGWLEAQPIFASIEAVGHRVVHGMKHSEPVRVTPKLLAELHRITSLVPDHLPREIALIDTVRRRHPRLPQFACFDTAFHRTMPSVAKALPIPRRYAAKGVERYGFHGLSYAYVLEELGRIDPAAVKGRVILAHLGNGASMTAVLNGRSIDTSMGFTPTAGLVMGTRRGDIDPGLVYVLARTQGMTAARFQRMVNRESGLLGMSGTSADVRDLLAREGADVRAAAAIAVFCYQAKKWIGAYAAVLGGLDTLVFAGGIGENAPLIRERICDGLGFLGIALDDKRNAKGAPLISRGTAHAKVRVIRTDEELVIARSVIRLLEGGTARHPNRESLHPTAGRVVTLSTSPAPTAFWSLPVTELFQQLGATTAGSSSADARQRLGRYGANHLKPQVRSSAFTLLLGHFRSPIVVLLLLATGLSIVLRDPVNAAMILAIVVASGLLGFWQEYSATSAVQKLLAMVQVKATTLRDGSEQDIPVGEVGPGDIVMLNAGDLVPGDWLIDESRVHAADVGMSVESAVDVTKEAADIVLLGKEPAVLVQGVRDGRTTFANTLKYVFMATSANFGYMFSLAGASLFLPYLPLLPTQVQLTNRMTDCPDMTIATDNVDPEMVDYPRRWDIVAVRKCMIAFGLVSSLFDGLTCGALLRVLRATTARFRTGWFLESGVSASLIVLVIRTRKPFFRSRPANYLLLATLLTVAVTVVLPFTALGTVLAFNRLPMPFLTFIAAIAAPYVIAAELVKRVSYKVVQI